MVGTICNTFNQLGVAVCNQCSFAWVRRVNLPKKCPNCQRRDWNTETPATITKTVGVRHVCAA
jgi:predicted Zn-ribbon and HTH transcriptional regulator